MAHQEEDNAANGLVTINEEFVANEQLNNCASGEQPAGTTAPQPSQPGSEAAALAAPAVVESDASSDGEHSGTAPGAAPAKNAKDNHQPAKDSRSQRPKQKRPRMAPPKETVAAATPAGQRAMPKSSPEVPEAADAAGPPGQQGQAGQAFPHMEAVSRVLALPIVDSGVNIVSGVYSKVKNVSPVVQWSLGTAEGAVRSSLGRSLSLLGPFSGPLAVVDSLLCRGLDMVEHSVPLITLPPELMVTAGRDYMSMRVVAPVLRVTATNARLADSLAARALDSADRYVDKFLPGDAATENGDAVGAATSKGGVALQRADRLSRKLQRRITRRTLLEAQALRKDTETTVHTLAFFAETLIKDPRAFVEQVRAVWSHLSESEPENQVPPETLEERLALLVREVARRVVHLANYTAASANPHTVSNVANNVVKSVRIEGTKVMTYAQSQLERIHMRQVLDDVNIYTHQLLERLAHLLAGLRNSSLALSRPFPHAGTNNISVVN